MIVKISPRGSDPGGLIRYLADTQTHHRSKANNVHTNPHIVTGSLGYTGPLDKETVAQVVGDLRTPLYLWQEQITKEGVIWHAAVVLSPGEVIGDEMWKNISKDFTHEMGVAEKGPSRTRWVSVNHGVNNAGSDHVHIAVNLICEDGRRIDPWNDYRRAMRVAAQLEDKYGLDIVKSRRAGIGTRPFNKDDHSVSVNQGRTEVRRVELERRVRAAAVGVLDVDEFAKNLAADGISIKFKENAAGTKTGYSINLPETTTKNGTQHWWAGGKLARDLSLPRLEQYWKNNQQSKHNSLRAVDELVSLQKTLPAASTEQLAVESHRIAGALAVVSAKTEPVPGPIAAASHQAGQLAQTRKYSQTIKPPALSVALLFSMAVDPDGPAGKAIMIRQLMATYQALLDAHRAKRAVVTPERKAPSMAGAEEEVVEAALTAGVTAGAVVLERHARHKQARLQDPSKPIPGQWDASSIRQMREQARWDEMRARAAGRELAPKITPEQHEKIQALADQFGAPGMLTGTELFTAREAAEYITHLEASVYSGPNKYEQVDLPQTLSQDTKAVDDFIDSLEAKHGHKDLSGDAEGSRHAGIGEGAARWAERIKSLTPEQRAEAAKAYVPKPDPSLTPAAKNQAKPQAPPGKNQHR